MALSSNNSSSRWSLFAEADNIQLRTSGSSKFQQNSGRTIVPALRPVRRKPLATRIFTASRNAFRAAPKRCAISGSVGKESSGFQTPLAISRPRAETSRSTRLTERVGLRASVLAPEFADLSEIAIGRISCRKLRWLISFIPCKAENQQTTGGGCFGLLDSCCRHDTLGHSLLKDKVSGGRWDRCQDGNSRRFRQRNAIGGLDLRHPDRNGEHWSRVRDDKRPEKVIPGTDESDDGHRPNNAPIKRDIDVN